MPTSRWLGLALAAFCVGGCRKEPPPPAAKDEGAATTVSDAAPARVASIDAGAKVEPAPAVTPRPAVLTPVLAAGNRRYLELSAWLQAAEDAGVDLAWGTGPVEQVDFNGVGVGTGKLQLASAAPVSLRAAIGTAVPAYGPDGTRCEARLGELYLVGYDNGAEMSDESYLVAEVVAVGCTPVVVTNRTAPRFFAPGPAPTPKQRDALLAAFRKLPGAGEREEPPLVRLFQGGGTLLAMVSIEDSTDQESSCGQTYSALRALFELGADGSVTLRGQTNEVFGTAAVVAVLDSDGDGNIEAILGPASFDLGMSANLDAASYLTFGAQPSVDRISFERYAGCD